MIELKNIYKTYTSKKKKVEVLKGISYKFESNKFYCIIGKSGAGKTTLIEIMGLLLKPDKGKIIIDNKDTDNLNDRETSQIRRDKIGFIFQNYYLNPLLTAMENVLLPSYDNDKALELLSKLDIKDRENHYPKELSGGEQQRVAIARALINNPKVILADEPSGSLDKDNAIKVLEILKNISKDNKCVIVVSHDDRVLKYADIVLTLENGILKEVK